MVKNSCSPKQLGVYCMSLCFKQNNASGIWLRNYGTHVPTVLLQNVLREGVWQTCSPSLFQIKQEKPQGH